MLSTASASQPSSSFGGSGTLSHVYIQYPPLRCSVPGSRGLFYDDGSKLLISPTSDQVISWKTASLTPHVVPTYDSISNGPVLSVRYSLDAKFLAIQRSNNEIQFWNRETGHTFSQRCRPESESILGFFWTDCPTCDIVFVKTSGLDLFSYNSESRSLHLVETKKMNVRWYVYTHESRLVLLASGMQCRSFTGYQISSAGIIRLPKFEMAMAKSEANNRSILDAKDVHIITVYSRIYCLQLDRVAMLLHSYRFYRDAVVQQGSLPIYSSKIAVSVIDNVLLVHQVDAKVVILYDIFSDSRAPISAPLPLLLRGFSRPYAPSSQSSSKDAESSEANYLSDSEAVIYGNDWTFLVPDLIYDTANGLLWKIHLDLEAISASCSEVPFVLEFLQRRKLEANKAKQICLSLARTIILERRPVSMVAKAINVLVTSYAYSIKTGCYLKGMKAPKNSSSGIPHENRPNPVSDDSTTSIDAFGKSIKHNSAGGVENKTMDRATFSNSDSNENACLGKIESRGPHSSADKSDREIVMGCEVSNAEVYVEAVQHQILGTDNKPLNVNVYDQQESQLTSAAISPNEICGSVFASVDEEMVGDASYLVAIIVEFLCSANLEKIKVHPNIYVLTVQLLARSERYSELGLFIINKIIEPSKEVALQLLESGRQNVQTRKLGLDMLRLLSLHHDYILLLLQHGYYLEALRYARKNKVDTVQPSLFLEAAFASNDSQHLAAVLRFFSDFIPGFKTTSDHHTYCRILTEMNSSIAI